MEQITQNNKLLAEFMGLISLDKNKLTAYLFPNGTTCLDTELKYNSDWNWLMEVVRECYSKEHHENNYYETIYYTLANLDIEAVYNACIEFVKWYNENRAKEN